jgi:hypothetical protein
MYLPYEYHGIFIPGLSDEPTETSIQDLLRERLRQYNRLGGEGWELVAEHQNPGDYAVVATFRRPLPAAGTEVQERAEPASGASYPMLRPDGSSPDSYRLVWDR